LNNAPFDAPSPWFHGQVIDMFYANGLDGYWPDWIPFLGGTYNNTPIFNFADACIFCGVVCILVFQKTFIDSNDETKLNLPSLKKNEHKLFLPPQIPFQLARQLIVGIGGGLAVLTQLVLLRTANEKSPSYILLSISILAIILMFLSY
jgi:hypothetical protein